MEGMKRLTADFRYGADKGRKMGAKKFDFFVQVLQLSFHDAMREITQASA